MANIFVQLLTSKFMTQTQIILKELQYVFNGPSWHGPSVVETLSVIKEENKNSSHGNSHTIIELVAHMTSWRKFVIERLKGNAYDVPDDMNFPKATDLNETVAALKSTQEELVKLISTFPDERMGEKVAGKPYSYRTMLHGIVQHDLYHLGQIGLLNRS
jgi:uncharacterized damage-inducible protein DinB